jgi:hypothetical protein
MVVGVVHSVCRVNLSCLDSGVLHSQVYSRYKINNIHIHIHIQNRIKIIEVSEVCYLSGADFFYLRLFKYPIIVSILWHNMAMQLTFSYMVISRLCLETFMGSNPTNHTPVFDAYMHIKNRMISDMFDSGSKRISYFWLLIWSWKQTIYYQAVSNMMQRWYWLSLFVLDQQIIFFIVTNTDNQNYYNRFGGGGVSVWWW